LHKFFSVNIYDVIKTSLVNTRCAHLDVLVSVVFNEGAAIRPIYGFYACDNERLEKKKKRKTREKKRKRKERKEKDMN
jgi:hypothetical protein